MNPFLDNALKLLYLKYRPSCIIPIHIIFRGRTFQKGDTLVCSGGSQSRQEYRYLSFHFESRLLAWQDGDIGLTGDIIISWEINPIILTLPLQHKLTAIIANHGRLDSAEELID